MEGLEIFFTLVGILIGLIVIVLNIILFFKVWKMTNDVKSIKENLNSSEFNLSSFALDDKEGMRDVLAKMFSDRVLDIVRNGKTDEEQAADIKSLASDYDKKAKYLNININFAELSADLFNRLKCIRRFFMS